MGPRPRSARTAASGQPRAIRSGARGGEGQRRCDHGSALDPDRPGRRVRPRWGRGAGGRRSRAADPRPGSRTPRPRGDGRERFGRRRPPGAGRREPTGRQRRQGPGPRTGHRRVLRQGRRRRRAGAHRSPPDGSDHRAGRQPPGALRAGVRRRCRRVAHPRSAQSRIPHRARDPGRRGCSARARQCLPGHAGRARYRTARGGGLGARGRMGERGDRGAITEPWPAAQARPGDCPAGAPRPPRRLVRPRGRHRPAPALEPGLDGHPAQRPGRRPALRCTAGPGRGLHRSGVAERRTRDRRVAGSTGRAAGAVPRRPSAHRRLPGDRGGLRGGPRARRPAAPRRQGAVRAGRPRAPNSTTRTPTTRTSTKASSR